MTEEISPLKQVVIGEVIIMMRSLYSGVSGLRVHQTKMDVIANNVSNINTVGFKKASTVFSTVLSQKLSGATAASDTSGKGGTNAMMIGLGSNVAAINNVMTTGSAERTDAANDIMINGDGFFVVSDVTGYYFTRAGAFSLDEEGNLIDTNGLKVCGWNVDENGKVVQGKAEGLNLYEGNKSYVEPQQTTLINFEGNLNADEKPNQVNTMSFYDSIGNRYTVDCYLTYNTSSKAWDFTMSNTATVNGSDTIELNGLDNITTSITFQDGLPVGGDTGALQIVLTELGFAGESPYNSSFAPQITIDFSNLTQFNTTVDATAVTKDGYEAGALSGYSIGGDGTITGTYTNGMSKTLGQIVVANFKNPAGLESIGSNLFAATVNSGDFDGIGVEVGADGSEFIAGTLEMSNVDLAFEFTEMITTQRGFQANSRIITTSDEMLQELVNLKR
jgi:flagellar hook protein FlgE